MNFHIFLPQLRGRMWLREPGVCLESNFFFWSFVSRTFLPDIEHVYTLKTIISATKTKEQKSGIYIHSLVERILCNTCLLNERMWLFHMVIEKLWSWVHKSVFHCYFYAFTKLIPYILWNIAFTFTIRCIYTLPTQSHKH